MEHVYLRPSFERPLLMTKFGLFGMDDIMCSGHGTQKTDGGGQMVLPPWSDLDCTRFQNVC